MSYARFYDPTGDRHAGMPTFPYRHAPNGLATRRQLRALGLRPGGQDIAGQILWRRGKRVAYLYRVDTAKPRRTATPAVLAALAKARAVLRHCPECDTTRPYQISRRHGMCFDCLYGGPA